MDTTTMSLQDKVAQLFTISAFGPELDNDTRRLIAEWKIGGVFLGMNCLIKPDQVHRLTSAMQVAAMEEGSGQPLFISADFVAGAGCKIKGGAVHFPKNRAIGAAADEELAYESGRVTAVESLALGVNFNYSPVVDINNNPLNPVIGTHSFGEDSDVVSRLGRAVIRGYQQSGMIATAKHFPGHGDTSVDSHEDLPVLPYDAERLRGFELIPFRQAIEAGVDAVMVGHIAAPALDPSLTPASLSYPITTGILREELGFEGLVVTDGLSMKGITNQYSMEAACVKALQAGSDILLCTVDTYDKAVSMLEAVISAVQSGQIPESRIEQSWRRIASIRRKYKLTRELFELRPYDASLLLSEDAVKMDAALAAKALTPLNGLQSGMLHQTGDTENGGIALVCDEKCHLFTERLLKKDSTLHIVTASSTEEVSAALLKLTGVNQVIVATAGSKPMGLNNSTLLTQRLALFTNAAWIHFGSEYDVADSSIPGLLLYDFAPSLQDAAADYLLGTSK